jgi:hypothetical protein
MTNVKEQYEKTIEKSSKDIGNQKWHRQIGGIHNG